VLARKPAPVQATWLDYFETTGVAEIDFVLSDAIHTPATDAPHFVEQIVWLPHGRFVYAAIAPTRATPLPREVNGFVTFGSYNRHAKITDDVAAVWRDLLLALPTARLVLRAAAYGARATVEWIRRRWRESGMPIERVEFRPHVPLAEAIDSYREIDVALDPFPYAGGATTCDALSMGVPVIALEGDRMIARQGASLLAAAGHPEWVARGAHDYVKLATQVATREDLARVRRDLFRGFASSPLCDVPGFTRSLEHAYRAMVERGARRDRADAAPIAVD